MGLTRSATVEVPGCFGFWSRYCAGHPCGAVEDCRAEVEQHSPPMDHGLKINLGAAKDIRSKSDGWVNVDIHHGPGIDFSFDAQNKWPFPDECAELVYCHHVLEHMIDWPKAVREAHRVLRKGGTLEVWAPYGVGWHNADPYHRAFFWRDSFQYFTWGDGQNTTLETDWKEPLFKLEKCDILRVFPYRSYLIRFLKMKFLERRYTFPLGIKVEVHWFLRKV